jgi:hypothetical protein
MIPRVILHFFASRRLWTDWNASWRQYRAMGVYAMETRHGYVIAYVDTGSQRGLVAVPLLPGSTCNQRLLERVAKARPLGLIE